MTSSSADHMTASRSKTVCYAIFTLKLILVSAPSVFPSFFFDDGASAFECRSGIHIMTAFCLVNNGVPNLPF